MVTLDGGNAVIWEMRWAGHQELRNLNIIGLGFFTAAELTLRNVHLSGVNNTSRYFAAVHLYESPLSGGSGILNLIDSTIEDNSVCAVLGGVSSEAVIERSTISGNSGGGCGGISVFSAEISNSTISGNSSLGSACEIAGGVDAGRVLISHSTIAGNAEIDLSYGQNEVFRLPKQRGEPPPDPPYICLTRLGDPVIVENSIIEGSCVNPAATTTPSGGGNVESPGNTCLFNDLTDHVNVSALDLGLDGLADNGGPTQTHALLGGSVAIDAAVFANCPTVDQRGVERPQGTGCDIGAYESEIIAVEIDIKPGSDPNAVNPSARGILPVAILGSDTFDVTDVDATTPAFGPGEAAPLHSSGGHAEDVNGDGYTDWVSHYRIEEVAVAAGDTELCLTGETLDGIRFEGCDAIVTVPYVGERRRIRVNRQR